MFRVSALLLACLAACAKSSSPTATPSLQAVQLLGTTAGDFDSHDTAAFDDGSYVVVGSFTGRAVFDRDGPNETMLEAAGPADSFVARYERDGSLRWVQPINGPGQQYVRAVSATADGSCIVAGVGWAEVAFADGSVLRNADGARGFAARIAGDGSILWTRGFGNPGTALDVEAIASFDDGSAIVAGSFWSRAVFGAGEANETELTHDDDRAFPNFVARIGPNGSLTFAWSLVDGAVNAIATLPDGSFYLTGGIRSTAVFAPGRTDAFAPTHSGNDGVDGFVARCSANGSIDWVRTTQASARWNAGAGWSVVAMSDGGCALVGRYTSDLMLDAGGPNETTLAGDEQLSTYAARYASGGDLRWARRIGSGFARQAPLGTTRNGDDLLLVAFTGDTSSADEFVRNPTLQLLDAGGNTTWRREDFDAVRLESMAIGDEGTITLVGTIQAPAMIAGAPLAPVESDAAPAGESVVARLR